MTSTTDRFRALRGWLAREWAMILAVVAFGILRFAHGLVTDDAFITFTYAKNLVAGHGFVFTVGDRTCGTTTPIYALFVGAGMALGFNPWLWVFLGDCVFAGVVLWRLRQLLRAAEQESWWPLLAILLGLSAVSTMSIAGMETECYMAVILSALAALARKEGEDQQRGAWMAVGWATLAAVIRPDGVAVLAVVLAATLLRGGFTWRGRVALMLIPLAALGAQALALWAYSGDALPQSIRAKQFRFADLPADRLLAAAVLRDWVTLFGQPHGMGIPALLGLVACVRRKALQPVVATYAAFLAGYFVVSAPVDFFWYRTLLYLLFFFFAVLGVASLAKRIASARGPRVAAIAGVALVVLLFPWQLSIYTILTVRALEDFTINSNGKCYRDLAQDLNAVDPGAIVAAHEVGALGYFSTGRVVDLEGIVSRGTLEKLRAKPPIDPLADRAIRWFAHPYYVAELPGAREQMEPRLSALGFTPWREYEWPWDGPGLTVLYRRDALPAQNPVVSPASK